MKILVYSLLVIIALTLAAFIGKTTINENGIEIERPLTAIAFICTLILAALNK